MTVQEQIEKVISGESKEETIPMTPIRDIEKILKGLGYNDLEMDGEETNGWQVDFWYTFTHNQKPDIMVSGSLHYGNFTISLSEEQDDEE